MHRTASVNEFSSRYSDVPDLNDTTQPGEWRLQSSGNRQGSSGEFLPEISSDPAMLGGRELSAAEAGLHDHARAVYQERLDCGIAKEQARKDLLLSQYTRSWWKVNLHNLLHFLGLRMDSHAQIEIRTYANQIGSIVEQLFPVTWEAFCDYRLNAITLTALDVEMIRNLVQHVKFDISSIDFQRSQPAAWKDLAKSRERDECVAKLKKLNLFGD